MTIVTAPWPCTGATIAATGTPGNLRQPRHVSRPNHRQPFHRPCAI